MVCSHPLELNFIVYCFLFFSLFFGVFFFFIFCLGFDPFNKGFYCKKLDFLFRFSCKYLQCMSVSEDKWRINKNDQLTKQTKDFDSPLDNAKTQPQNFSQLNFFHVNSKFYLENFLRDSLKIGLFLTWSIPLGTYSFCWFW